MIATPAAGPVYCFVAAHSAGHILPAMTLAQHTKNQHPLSQILLITRQGPLESQILLPYRQLSLITTFLELDLPKFPYQKLINYPIFVFKFVRACYHSWRFLKRWRPQKVVATGGLIAIPVGLSAWWLGLPLEIYELNLEPGRATKFLAPVATTIKICFAATKKFFRLPSQSKCQIVPYPVRFSRSERDTLLTHSCQTLQTLNLRTNANTIFILGGSQGSAYLNQKVAALVTARQFTSQLSKPIQIIHQVGKPDEIIKWQNFYAKHQIKNHVFAYEPQLGPLYSCADLIIARAGAGSLAEIEFFAKPAVIIPLQARTTAHQIQNAQAWAQKHPDLFTVLLAAEINLQPTLFKQAVINKLI